MRPYQAEAVDKIVSYFQDDKNKKNLALVAPTAAGKSIIIAESVVRMQIRIVVFAPNKELVAQNFEKYSAYGYLNAGIFCAGLGLKEIKQVTFATIMSAKNCPERFMGFDYAIIDECDLVKPETGSMYLDFMQKVGIKKCLGLTATPIRNYPTQMGTEVRIIWRTRPKFFDDVLYHVPVKTMVENNWWAHLQYVEYDFDESSLRLKSNGLNYTEDSIKKAMEANDTLELMKKHIFNLKGGRSALVFCSSTQVARELHAFFPNSACVTDKTKPADREYFVDNFRKGKIKLMFNYSVFSVGFDYSDLDCIFIQRPTNSIRWYQQVIGRLVRVPDIDKVKYVIDYCNNVKRFGYVENIDIRKHNVGKSQKYSLFNNNVLLSNTPLDEIGSKWLGDDGYIKVKKRTHSSYTRTIHFGEHSGKPLAKVPMNYLKWCGTKSWCPQYIRDEISARASRSKR